MASILANVPVLKDCGWDYSRVLHGEEGLVLHRPLPPAADLVVDARVVEAYDKGRDKGALVYTETTVRDAADDRPLFTLTRSLFARGDGGFGGATGPSPKPHVGSRNARPTRLPRAGRRVPIRRSSTG